MMVWADPHRQGYGTVEQVIMVGMILTDKDMVQLSR